MSLIKLIQDQRLRKMFRIKAVYLFFKSPSEPNRSVCCIEWKKARSSRCCAVFGHFLYCFASFDSRDFKFSATSDRKGPGCVAEFCAMYFHILLLAFNKFLISLEMVNNNWKSCRNKMKTNWYHLSEYTSKHFTVKWLILSYILL